MTLSSFVLGLWWALIPSAEAATALTATQTSIIYGSNDCYAYTTDYENRYIQTWDLTAPVASDENFGWNASLSGTGTFAVGTSSNTNSTYVVGTGGTSGGYASFHSMANDTSTNGLALGTSRQCLKFRATPTNLDLDQRMELLGFGSSVVNGTGYATGGASSCVCFRIDVTTTNETLKAVTKLGASETVTDTGITQVLDTMHTFEIVATSTSVSFFIDGASVATHTTNIPTAVIFPILSIRSKENVAKQTQFDWMQYSRPRS